jgi:hypothetical protein
MGEFSAEDRKRLEIIARLFGVDTGLAAGLTLVPSEDAPVKAAS